MERPNFQFDLISIFFRHFGIFFLAASVVAVDHHRQKVGFLAFPGVFGQFSDQCGSTYINIMLLEVKFTKESENRG